MPRLLRLRLVDIGHPNARFDDLTLDFADPEGAPCDSTIWLRNGGGKSSLLNLFFTLVRPDRREFLGSRAEAKQRRLEDYVQREDHAVVACEWALDGDGQPGLGPGLEAPERFVTGIFHEWRAGTTDNALRRLFFAGRVGDDPRTTLAGLPLFRQGDGKRSRHRLAAFRQEWQGLRDLYPHLQLFATENQGEWIRQLTEARIDPELFAYQVRMNRHEGGVDELFRFPDGESFIDFLLELALPPERGAQLGSLIETFRSELSQHKKRWQPERELLQGLIDRLEPLVALAQRREEQSRSAATLRRKLDQVGSYLDDRVRALEVEAVAAAEESSGARAQAEQAGRERHRALQKAAALRRFAARREHEAAEQELRRTQQAMEEATRQARIWEAAVPLAEAHRHEARARDFKRQLSQRKSEHAPLLQELQEVATALAGLLDRAHEEASHRVAESRARRQEARQEAEEAREAQASCRERAARAQATTERLREELAEADADRERLVQEGALGAEELAAQALSRLRAHREGLERREGECRRIRDGAATRRRELQGVQHQAAMEQVQAEEKHRTVAERLGEAKALREQLEQDRLLRRHLQAESVDLAKVGPAALELLRQAARRALDQLVDLRLERASGARAVRELEESGLLPPAPAVGRLLAELRRHRLSAWTGWAWIEEHHSGIESRRRELAQHPALVSGIVVRDADFVAACEKLAAPGNQATAGLDEPVLVAPTSAFDEAGGGHGRVFGPASDAHFDREAGVGELQRRRHRQAEVQEGVQRVEAERAELEEFLRRLQAFLAEHPVAWFEARRRELEELQRRAQRCADRQERCRLEIGELESRERECAAELGELHAEASRVARQQTLLEEYRRRHEEPAARRRRALAEAEQEADAARSEAGDWALESRELDARARALDEQIHRHEQIAHDCLRERRELSYVREAGEGVELGLPLSGVRDRYRDRKATYEQRVGADGLLRAQKEAEAEAQRKRSELEEKLSESLTEELVAEALDQLDDPAQADRRRREANVAVSSAQGSLGRRTQILKSAEERLERAEGHCQELGGVGPLAPDEAPPGPIQAEEKARAADEEARRLAAEERNQQQRAERAAERRRECEHRRDGLVKDRERLDGMVESHEDLLPRSGTAHARGPGAEAPTPTGIGPQEDAQVPERLSRLSEALRGLREELAELDVEREAAVRALRELAQEERYQELRETISRQLARAEPAELEERAARHQEELRLRVQVLEQQMLKVDEHRQALLDQAMFAAEEGLALMRSAASHSRLPDHVPGLGGAQFLRINMHVPDVPEEQRGRLAQLVDELLEEGSIPGGLQLVQRAVRRLARPIQVTVLSPDLEQGRRIPIADMARFSGGEQLTGAILLYCTLAQLRARNRGVAARPSSVLLLDNPIGRASRTRFLELQRGVAQAMGVQLIYTTAVNDLEALRALPNVLRIRNERVDRVSGMRVVEHGEPPLEVARVFREGGHAD